MAIWLTSDTHFGHANIIRYCGRPFETKQEHDETLTANWNKLVKSQDTIYHMGDFGFGSPAHLRQVADKLHGKICLLKGNHDKHCNVPLFADRFHWIKDYHLFQQDNKKIVMMHYSLRSWHFSNHGAAHAWGHSHSNLPPWGLSFDVGVDNIYKLFGEYRPISLDEFWGVIDTLKVQLDYDKKKEEPIISDPIVE